MFSLLQDFRPLVVSEGKAKMLELERLHPCSVFLGLILRGKYHSVLASLAVLSIRV